MAKIAIVVGHAQRDTFCEALGEAYKSGAEQAGHAARLFVLSRMKFDPILHAGYRKVQKLEPDLRAAYRALAACDHLVIVFPLWCGDMPALLKGFIERILQPDLIARRKTEHAMNWRIFSNKSARIVMTMGMPVTVYRFWYGPHALKLLKRNILHFIGIKPVRATLIGEIGDVPLAKRQSWLAKVAALGRAAA